MRIVVLLCLLSVFALAGCDYVDEGDPAPSINPLDPRSAAIGGAITGALDALNGREIESFYDFVSLHVNQKCSAEQVAADLSDANPKRARLRRMNQIAFESSDLAKVNITVITTEGDVDQEWMMFQQYSGIWLIVRMPGLDECAPSDDPV